MVFEDLCRVGPRLADAVRIGGEMKWQTIVMSMAEGMDVAVWPTVTQVPLRRQTEEEN